MVPENKTNESKMLRTAIVYDFDGTLARGNIQEHTFLPDMGIPKEKFWADVQDEAKSTDSDEILVYMRKMLEAAEGRGKPLKRSALREHGRSLPLFEGVTGWEVGPLPFDLGPPGMEYCASIRARGLKFPKS